MKYQLLHQETSVTPLTLGMNHRGFHHRLHTKYTRPFYFKDSVIVYKNYKVDWYGDIDNFCELGQKVIDNVKKDKTFSKRLLLDVVKIGQELDELDSIIISENFARLTKLNLLNQFKKLFKLSYDICDLGAVAVYPDLRHYKLSTLLKNIIKEKIVKYNLPRKTNDYFSILITPTITGLVQREKNVIQELAIEIQRDKALKNDWLRLKAKDVLKKQAGHLHKTIDSLYKLYSNYRWSAFGQLGPSKTLDDYIVDIKSEIKNPILKKQILEAKKHLNQIFKLQNLYYKELRLTKVEINLFKAARDFSENKVYRFDILLKTWLALDLLLREIANRTKYTVNDLRFMSPEEIVSLLTGRKIIPISIIKNRQKFCLTLIKNNSIIHLTGEQAKSYLRHNIEAENIQNNIKTLHGSVAYMGRVSGRVKIVNSPKDISKVKKGDILVSTQTNPDLLPAMRKAGAFVTDVGGITSHAAIVARELKKPCIIGTKIASKIFKDGDRVDVDAIKGNVTLIK